MQNGKLLDKLIMSFAIFWLSFMLLFTRVTAEYRATSKLHAVMMTTGIHVEIEHPLQH